MRVEDVPIAWSIAACRAAYKRADELRMNVNKADLQQCMDHIIAAVAPLIAAAERACCIEDIQTEMLVAQNDLETSDDGSLLSRLKSQGAVDACLNITAAIRARGEIEG